ncbi:MAG: hypothetical protein HBSAPP03_05770 [Phycisphaerae bacterium]|nr:MAG: hypothetical protein HBSAPP03_05770 [Phycisphaerae bacterium]
MGRVVCAAWPMVAVVSIPAVHAQPTTVDATGRLHAPVGRPLIVPIAAPVEGRPLATLDDGRAIPARAYRLTVTPAGFDAWLGPVFTWTSGPIDAKHTPASGGAYVCVIEPPIEAVGRDLIITGERRAVNWLPSPDTLPRDETGREVWAPQQPAVMPADALGLPRFSVEAKSPVTRWRYRLLTDGLHPDTAPCDGPFADAVIEAMARQEEDRWRLALAWLWGADPELASRVRARLAAVIEFEPGQWAPAWAVEPFRLRRLLDDLLMQNITPPQRAGLGERWLAELPPLAAWVVDDGGVLDPATRSVRPTIAVASLLDRSTLAWATWGTPSDANPDLQPMPPMTVRTFTFREPTPEPPALRSATAYLGGTSIALGTFARAMAAKPPGLQLRNFYPDQSMNGLMSGTFESNPPAWSTAARLYRVPARSGKVAPVWGLFVECAIAPGEGVDSHEHLDVFLGPVRTPRHVVRFWRDGRVEHLDGAGDTDGMSSRVYRGGDRWSISLTLPRDAVEPGGVLRLGLVRHDARGRRSASPRAMLPWQTEPSRLAIDVTAWDDF